MLVLFNRVDSLSLMIAAWTGTLLIALLSAHVLLLNLPSARSKATNVS